MDAPAEEWWRIGEQSFRSRKRFVGPLIGWVRSLGFALFSKWYLGPLIEQQNKVNRELVSRLEAGQEIAVALDHELTDLRRQQAEVVYKLQEQQARLRARLDALGAEVDAGSVQGDTS